MRVSSQPIILQNANRCVSIRPSAHQNLQFGGYDEAVKLFGPPMIVAALLGWGGRMLFENYNPPPSQEQKQQQVAEEISKAEAKLQQLKAQQQQLQQEQAGRP